MPRKSRPLQRILADQDSVADLRAERLDVESKAGSKLRSESALTKEQRLARLREKEAELSAHPKRIARAGKPLKRPR
jgi:hypothetical protein